MLQTYSWAWVWALSLRSCKKFYRTCFWTLWLRDWKIYTGFVFGPSDWETEIFILDLALDPVIEGMKNLYWICLWTQLLRDWNIYTGLGFGPSDWNIYTGLSFEPSDWGIEKFILDLALDSVIEWLKFYFKFINDLIKKHFDFKEVDIYFCVRQKTVAQD